MEGPARAGHDPGGGLRLEWPDFRQPVPDRQGDDGDQLEQPSLLRASAGKSRRCGSGKGPPKGRASSSIRNASAFLTSWRASLLIPTPTFMSCEADTTAMRASACLVPCSMPFSTDPKSYYATTVLGRLDRWPA